MEACCLRMLSVEVTGVMEGVTVAVEMMEEITVEGMMVVETSRLRLGRLDEVT